MKHNRSRHQRYANSTAAAWLIAFFVGFSGTTSRAAKTQSVVDFVQQVRPLLQRHCVSCHGAKQQEGGLRLDHREDALRGGDSGNAIAPGNAADSLLIARVTEADDGLRMPQDKPPLTLEEIKLLRAWVDGGADWPAEASSRRQLQTDHWAFQPVERPPPPVVRHSDWVRNPIDSFVVARLEAAGIAPSPEADRATLVRRLHLDLTGLPPTPEMVDDWEQGNLSYQALVAGLLDSLHFGERWALPWLDLARYADSDGYEMDHPRPNAWRWRDWVIDAINRDMPFDQFTIEQIAGDLLPDASASQQLATGFHRNTLTNRENGVDKEEFRVKAVIDRVNTTGTVWLGLTVGCAECHSHKYDPIRQREYYQLFAFFNDRVDESEIAARTTSHDRAVFLQAQREHANAVRKLQDQLAVAKSADRKRIMERLAKLNKQTPQLTPHASGFQARSRPRQSHVHLRGNFLDHGPAVRPGVPEVLPSLQATQTSLDRLDLARWLVDPANPLTARVEMNRIWQQLFGVGLVTTPGDFGTQGEPPTHPQLLDWLASEFVRGGWSRKRLIQLIVTSSTYRQASAARADLIKVDPKNRLLARQNRFRLDAELVRDQYLAVAGLLNRQIGGPSFYPPLPAGWDQIGFKVSWKADPPEQQRRRGMYLVTRRNLAVPMLTTFDRPDANVTCVRRERSNSPLQSLTQMNDPLMMESARAFASRVRAASAETEQERITAVFRSCLGRNPVAEESEAMGNLFRRLTEIYENDLDAARTLVAGASKTKAPTTIVEHASWIMLGRTIMNLDEFVTRE